MRGTNEERRYIYSLSYARLVAPSSGGGSALDALLVRRVRQRVLSHCLIPAMEKVYRPDTGNRKSVLDHTGDGGAREGVR